MSGVGWDGWGVVGYWCGWGGGVGYVDYGASDWCGVASFEDLLLCCVFDVVGVGGGFCDLSAFVSVIARWWVKVWVGSMCGWESFTLCVTIDTTEDEDEIGVRKCVSLNC